MEETEKTNGNGGALIKVQHQTALEPRSLNEAIVLCKMAVASGLLPKAVSKPEAALMILMRGRELGLTAMQSFASINVIEGKTSMSAELIVAKVKQRPDVCKYFRFVEGDEKKAVFETWRVGDPEPTEIQYTIEQATALGLAGKDNWKKQAANMLRWRCATALARLVYPELTLGLYSPDEAEDIVRDARVADAQVIEQTAVDDLESRIATFDRLLDDATSPEALTAVVAEVNGDPAKKIIMERLGDKYKARKASLAEARS